ncbi:MAG TPA: DUF5615 family PIN-like protein [Tepidiformaceae bacterium]|nr:DUF5615 family PIN-like protein [Tepidiformaceae bacterium]
MTFLLDENLSTLHAAELRSEGYDACGVVEAGLSGATDEAVRDFAIAQGRVLITLDADFANLQRFPPGQTPGVVRLKVHPATEESIRKSIRRAVALVRTVDLAGRLAVVDKEKVRIRS